MRQTAPDRWVACCPAHDDRSPSLSIRETDDGTLLLRCWAGCEAGEIVAAVGLELRDLFPRRWRPAGRGPLPVHKRPRLSPRDALVALHAEAVAVHLALCDALEATDDREAIDRLAIALRRIGDVLQSAEVLR